jgi:DNA-binding Xre family transcriptional regulator
MQRRRTKRTEPISKGEKQRDRALRMKYAGKPSPDQLNPSEFTPAMKQGEYLALMHFIHCLKAERQFQKMSLADLADRTGIDKAAISRLENGLIENPTIATLERLARSVAKRLRIELEDDSHAR